MKHLQILGAAVVAAAIAWTGAGSAQTARPAARPAAPPISSSAERIYAAAQPSLLQIRTLVVGAGRQSVIGSGFVVSAEGLAVTNWHVVSRYALEPETYRLEYAAADGGRGSLTLLATDVANDLAVVRLDRADRPFLEFDERALTDRLPTGERLYSMGNPLDLGFTIVEGTHNGRVERSYAERIHFTGALNPGMSGGPAVAADGRLVGINVAKQLGSDLVSFLVPSRFAAALLDRVPAADRPARELRADIGRQLTRWQAALHGSLATHGPRSVAFGPYEAAESAAPWFSCWARTNAGDVPKPRAVVSTSSCSSSTGVFVADDLSTGIVQMSHSHLRSVDLNGFQFAAVVSQQSQLSWGGRSRRWHTGERCQESFLAAPPGDERPAQRALLCARAYREFDGLYDVWVVAVTQDNSLEALVSRLTLQGVGYEAGMAEARRFMEAVRFKR